MTGLQPIIEALGVISTPTNLAILIAGVCVGVVAGSIPGFTGANTVAIALPLTLPMSPGIALAFMSAIYIGANYGGAIPAVLINTPGTSGATATVLDAFPMSKQGRASQALGISILASVIGGIVSAMVILVLLDPIGTLAFQFTNREIFVLGLFGLAAVGATLGDNLRKGLFSGFLGLLIAAMPIDPTTGQRRLDFGFFALYDEVPFIPIIIGVFAITELFFLINREKISEDTSVSTSYSGILEGFKYVVKRPFKTVRSMGIGLVIGSMPGAGTSIANFVSWAVAKLMSAKPEEFGEGNPDGVIASEASNSAVTAGSLVPTLALGIPGSGTTAVMLGALLLHGVQPGPTFMQDFAFEANLIIVSLLVSNLFLLVFAFAISKYVVRVVLLPSKYLVPSILVLTVIGAYALRTNLFDAWLMMLFGVVGIVMRKNDYPPVPLILGVVLGPIVESAFLRSMLVSGNDPMYFFETTIAKIFWVLIVISLVGRPLYNLFQGTIQPRIEQRFL